MLLFELLSFFSRMTWIPALCILIGFCLIAYELFTPGFGVAGISGIILLILSIMITAKSFVEALIMLFLILIVIAIIIFLAARSALKGKLTKIILQDSLKKELGYSGRDNLESYIGEKGVALTVLRPSGTGLFNNVKLDVVTEGEFIPKGSNIEIIKVEGMRIVVRKID
ncbi:MAG TPA: hypothetical protein GXX37_08035 [Clostridiaceae bacterium]|nr:hypothetical protein [Clostridiaceae bacterium]